MVEHMECLQAFLGTLCNGTLLLFFFLLLLRTALGITKWAVKWHWHGWHIKSKEVGHRDMWEAIFALRREAGSLLQFVWTPSHMKVKVNDRADSLAEEGRLQHPHNKKRRWEEVGLYPMRSDVSSSSGDVH